MAGAWRSMFLSDVHLGSPEARADRLLRFLRANEAETLYLVGDLIDGWSLERRWYFPASHRAVLREIFERARRGTRVVYVPGNHDEAFRRYEGLDLAGIECVGETVHRSADGRRFLVLHGDRFDAGLRKSHWSMRLGGAASGLARLHDALEGALATVKQRWKRASGYLEAIERRAVSLARKRRMDGVICGHTHTAEIRTRGGVTYCNDGDWVASCTSLVERFDGTLELLHAERSQGRERTSPRPSPPLPSPTSGSRSRATPATAPRWRPCRRSA